MQVRKMKLRRLFNIITKVELLLLVLTSCDPIDHVDNYVSWSIENRSAENLEIWKFYDGGNVVEHSLFAGDDYKLNMEECYDSDTMAFESPIGKWDSVCVADEKGMSFFKKTLSSKSNWCLSIKSGDSIPDGEGPGFSEYDTWYDYTFTITDEMLEAARKGGGE